MKSVKVTHQIAYANGKQVTVEAINIQSVFDNLFDHVTFRYILLDANGVHCGEGAYELKGERYDEWDASPENAYEIVIDGLGLEILPTIGKSSIFEG
jgi:adenine-specific DNA methylase